MKVTLEELKEKYSTDIEREEILKAVMEYMCWHREKAMSWYQMKNPYFGYLSPKNLVELGKAKKVWSFISAAKEGAFP